MIRDNDDRSFYRSRRLLWTSQVLANPWGYRSALSPCAAPFQLFWAREMNLRTVVISIRPGASVRIVLMVPIMLDEHKLNKRWGVPISHGENVRYRIGRTDSVG